MPYPVQHAGTELILEYLGTDDGRAAPRLVQLRPGRDELCDLWRQLVDALVGLARHGLAHGDLSAFNLLVHDGRLVVIDLPQVVDVVGNPNGPEYLARDVRRIGEWFSARRLPPPPSVTRRRCSTSCLTRSGSAGRGRDHRSAHGLPSRADRRPDDRSVPTADHDDARHMTACIRTGRALP